jgi:predicted TPR repeat methyltransferase
VLYDQYAKKYDLI